MINACWLHTYIISAVCLSQYISSLLTFSTEGKEDLGLVEGRLVWVVANPEGYGGHVSPHPSGLPVDVHLDMSAHITFLEKCSTGFVSLTGKNELCCINTVGITSLMLLWSVVVCDTNPASRDIGFN